MGKGKHWDKIENEALVTAWLTVSTDPSVKQDQAGKRFFRTVFDVFANKAPDPIPPGRYGFRSPDSCRQHFNDISADCHKFREVLQRVLHAKPRATSNDELISMAVAIHVGKTDAVISEMRNIPHDEWVNARAWKLLSASPQWQITNSPQSDQMHPNPMHLVSPTADAPDEHDSVSNDHNHPQEDITLDVDHDDTPRPTMNGTSATPTPLMRNKRRAELPLPPPPPPLHPEKAARRNTALVNAVVDMAKAVTRRNEAMEERNGILVFLNGDDQLQSEEDLKMKQEFLRTSRQIHLARAKRRLRTFAHDRSQIELDTRSPTMQDQEAMTALLSFIGQTDE